LRKHNKWFAVIAVTLSLGFTITDYPPQPKAVAHKQAVAPDFDWILEPHGELEEEEEPNSLDLAELKALEEARAAIAREQERVESERVALVLDKERIMAQALVALESEIGTPYVFSGSTPRGWDCSGLVRWLYLEHFGIELEHSATAQAFSGYEVETPLAGDIVIFGYNEKDFHHSAVYVGDNKVIHSGFSSGQRTEFLSLNHPSVENSYVKFVRLVETRP
jgi:cell wall-associated NlpC family hydrolase